MAGDEAKMLAGQSRGATHATNGRRAPQTLVPRAQRNQRLARKRSPSA